MTDLVSKLQEVTVDQQISKGLAAAQVLARQGINAYSLEDVTKALDTAESGGGADFVFTGMSAEVINQVRQALIVSSQFPHITMPTNPYKVPVELNPATAYVVPENTADSGQTSIGASQAGTSSVTFDAPSIGAITRTSKELNQDSIIPMVPFIQKNLMRGLAEGLENAIINGDTTATHQDTDIEASGATNVATAFKGLRKHALANSYSTDISTWNLSALRTMRRGMGKFGINPEELFLIVSNSAYVQMLSWAELVTVDKYGPSATVVTGEIGKVDGVRVVVSPQMREDLDATGVNGASGNTKTGVLLVNRNGFAVGDRQTVELDQTDEPKAFRQISILADTRVDFQPTHPIASNPTVWYGYNLAS